jgi:hypothetical protein
VTLSGRPLLDNRVDAELFVDREQELVLLFSALEHSFNTLVTGDAGSGKTSLLRALMYQARHEGKAGGPIGDYSVRYVRAEGVSDGGELVVRIAQEVLGADYGPSRDAIARTLTALRDAREREMAQTHERWREAGESIAGSRFASVIVVDDVNAAAGQALFGRLRDELWELGYIWVVAARNSERGGLLLPPADAFFEREVQVGPLTGAAAAELVTKRTGSHSGSWPEDVAKAVGGNPRRILAAARDLIDQRGSFDSILDAITRRDTAIQAMGRSESMLAAELDALGAASASDEALLSRLGWTRARAVQVLGTLEAAGLVRSEDVRSGQGRPRKVFRLTPPADYVEYLREREVSG